MDTPLSNHDLERLMNDMNERANIIESSDIKETDNIEDIFNGKGHAIIFVRHPNQKIGHWTVMVRQHDPLKNGYSKNGNVYYFDSFGERPKNKNIEKVVLKSYPELLYNDIKFQADDSNACGRHCLLITALNKMGLKPRQIEEVLKKMLRKNGGSLDKFVIEKIRN